MRKPLPTNTSTFRKVIEGGFLYVDKTEYIYQLVHRAAGAYFLSRPRRFGKSLFISTLEEIFTGNRDLFKGLWIDSSDYEWPIHPVVRLDLSLYPSVTPDDLKENLKLYLQYVAEKYHITLRPGPYYAQFGDLIRQLSAETQVVILIDVLVENAFLIHLLDRFSNFQQGLSVSHLWQLIEALREHNLNNFFKARKVFFANIDYALHLRNEKYYQTIFYLIFMLMGLKIEAEVKTNDGRIDAVVEVDDHIYIFEFKLDQDAQEALNQIIDKEYAQKYSSHRKNITQVGVNFDSKSGQVSDWQTIKGL